MLLKKAAIPFLLFGASLAVAQNVVHQPVHSDQVIPIQTALNHISIIMLPEKIVRVYGSALSQYSRVKVPAEAVGGKPHEKIEYRSIGLSEGFGSFHISQETLDLMGTLIGRSKDARKVNSIFGEGVNPLMRKIREGMEMLGLPSEVLMNHGNKRVVYGVALARNFRDVLLGFKDAAQYSVPLTRDKVRTEMLADFWRRRWLLNRLEKPGILNEVSRHTVVYPIRHGAQVVMPEGSKES